MQHRWVATIALYLYIVYKYVYSSEISLHCCICGKHEIQPRCEVVNMWQHACVFRRFYCCIGVDSLFYAAYCCNMCCMCKFGSNKTAANCFITHAQIINIQYVDRKWVCNNNNNTVKWNCNNSRQNAAIL